MNIRTYQLYVNGEWRGSKAGRNFPVYDPSTEQIIAQVPDADAEDVNCAVARPRLLSRMVRGLRLLPKNGRELFRLAEKIRQNAAMAANWNRATAASQSSRRSSILRTSPLALNITAAKPPRFLDL